MRLNGMKSHHCCLWQHGVAPAVSLRVGSVSVGKVFALIQLILTAV